MAKFPDSQTVAPNVFIAETDLSFFGQAAPFAITAMVGFATSGPINEPTKVTSIDEFIRIFGKPDPSIPAYLAYAAIEFLRKGVLLWVVRVGEDRETHADFARTASVDVDSAGPFPYVLTDPSGPGITTSGTTDVVRFRFRVNGVNRIQEVTVPGGTYTSNGLAAALAAELDPDFHGITIEEFGTVSGGGTQWRVRGTLVNGSNGSIEFVSAENDGATAMGIGTGRTSAVLTGDPIPNLSGVGIDFDVESTIPRTLEIVVFGTGNTLVDGVSQFVTFERDVYTSLDSPGVTADSIIDQINDSDVGKYIVASAWPSGSKDQLRLTTVHTGQDAGVQVKNTGASSTFGFSSFAEFGTSPSVAFLESDCDVNPLAPTGGIVTGVDGCSDEISFTIEGKHPGTAFNGLKITVSVNAENGDMTLQVLDGTKVVENWTGLNKDETDPDNKFYIEKFINEFSNFINVTDNTDTEERPAPGTYTLGATTATEGSNGIPDLAEDQDTLIIGDRNLQTGIWSLADVDRIDIDLIAVPGVSSTDVLLTLREVCEDVRLDCMTVFDPPFGMDHIDVRNWHNGLHPLNTVELNSSYAALYWPWLLIRDPFNNVDVWVPPSGPVLGVYANSEAVSFPWFAPAGLNRGKIETALETERFINTEHRDDLYGNGNAVNSIVDFPADGIVVWGQRTLQRRPTALDRVNVRRLMLWIEKTLKKRARTLLFEPNDVIVQEQFTTMATEMLSRVQSLRGIHDFRVIADARNNTADTMDRSELWAKIGVQPVKATEFIFIEFTINRQGSFEESDT